MFSFSSFCSVDSLLLFDFGYKVTTFSGEIEQTKHLYVVLFLLSEHSIRMLVRKGLVTSIRTGEGKNGKILINKQSLLNYLNGIV